MEQGKVYISCNYSWTISSLVKILLVNLNYLYNQYAWISIMKKQNSNQNFDGWEDGGTRQNFWPLPLQVSTFSATL